MTSYRIGKRPSSINGDSATSESAILRSLFELRKSFNLHSTPLSCDQPERQDNITDLTFWNCQWSPRILQSLRKLFVRDSRRFSTIKFLFSDINENSYFAELLGIILKNNSTISLVIQGGRRIKNTTTETESESMSSLHHWSQSSESHSFAVLNDSVLFALREGLVANTSLKSLKLSALDFETNSPVSSTAADTVAPELKRNDTDNNRDCWIQSLMDKKSLRHLDLSGSNLSTSMLKTLSNTLSLNNYLECLNMSRCCLDDESLSNLLDSVTDHPFLTKLNLAHNCLGGTSTKAIEAFADLLRSEKTRIRYLDLSHQRNFPHHYRQQASSIPNQISTTSSASVQREQDVLELNVKTALSKCLLALSTNMTIETIHLTGNYGCFADVALVEALSNCLLANNTLKYVNVSSCGMTSEGIRYLSDHYIPYHAGASVNGASRMSSSLEALILFDDFVEGIGNIEPDASSQTCGNSWHQNDEVCSCPEVVDYAQLERAMQSNVRLTNLGTLPGNNEHSRRIQHILNMNKAGRRAFVHSETRKKRNAIPLGLWPFLLARADSLEYEYDCFNTKKGKNRSHVDNNNRDSNTTTISSLFGLLHEGPVMLQR